jgi:hypothetical protein
MREDYPENKQSEDEEMNPKAKEFFNGIVYLIGGVTSSTINYVESQPTSRIGAYIGAVCIGIGVHKIINGLSDAPSKSRSEEQ